MRFRRKMNKQQQFRIKSNFDSQRFLLFLRIFWNWQTRKDDTFTYDVTLGKNRPILKLIAISLIWKKAVLYKKIT